MTQDAIVEVAPGHYEYAPRVAGDVPQLVRPQHDRQPGRFGGKFPDSDHDQIVRQLRSDHEMKAGRCTDIRMAIQYWQQRVDKDATQLQADSSELQKAKQTFRLYVRELRELEYRYGGILQPIPAFKEEPFDVEQPA